LAKTAQLVLRVLKEFLAHKDQLDLKARRVRKAHKERKDHKGHLGYVEKVAALEQPVVLALLDRWDRQETLDLLDQMELRACWEVQVELGGADLLEAQDSLEL